MTTKIDLWRCCRFLPREGQGRSSVLWFQLLKTRALRGGHEVGASSCWVYFSPPGGPRSILVCRPPPASLGAGEEAGIAQNVPGANTLIAPLHTGEEKEGAGKILLGRHRCHLALTGVITDVESQCSPDLTFLS